MDDKHLVVRLAPKDKKWIKRMALEHDITIKKLVMDSIKLFEKNHGGSNERQDS